jgi:hypothetical protein
VSSWFINFLSICPGGINYQFADNKTACMACEPERAKKKKKKDQDNNSSAESPEAEAGKVVGVFSLSWGFFYIYFQLQTYFENKFPNSFFWKRIIS